MLRTPKAHFSPYKRTQIVTEYLLGMPAKVVAIKYGTSPRGVYGVVQRSRIQKSCISRPKTGRPPALSQTDKDVLRRLVTQDPFATAGQLKLRGEIGCSSQTITRHLLKSGLTHHFAIQRPFLKQEHVDARLAFARRWRHKPPEFWDDWIFGDETSVDMTDGQRRKKVWCPPVSLTSDFKPDLWSK
jgi:transposase